MAVTAMRTGLTFPGRHIFFNFLNMNLVLLDYNIYLEISYKKAKKNKLIKYFKIYSVISFF